MTGVITDILSQQAFDQLDQLNKKLAESIASFEKTAAAAKLLDQAVAGAKNITDYTTASEKLVSATKEMTDAGKQVETTYVKIKDQTTQATAAIKGQTGAAQLQINAYKNLFASTEALSKQIAQYKIEITQLTERQKELKTEFDKSVISQNSYIAKSAAVIAKQNELKVALSQAQLEFKNQTKEQQAAESSMVQLAQTLAKLKAAYRQLSESERGGSQGTALLGDITQLDTQIKQLDESLGEHQRKVGSYSAAIAPLKNQLSTVNTQMQAMAANGQQDSDAFQNLTEQQEKLNTIIGEGAGKIASATAELGQIKNALIQMEAAGLKGSETYERLTQRAIELKEAQVGTTNAIKEGAGLQITAMDKLGNMFTRLFERITIYFGIYQAFFAFKNAIEADNKAFEDMEDSVSRLNNILENIGRSDVIDRINGKIAVLANQFKYLDQSDIREIFTQLITYGKLTEGQIDQLLPIIINFAAKARVSVSQAAADIIRAFEGNSRALKEYGINLKGTTDESQRFGIITQAMQKRVESAGAAFEKTAQGQIADYKQELKDAQEQTGKSTIQMAIWWEQLKTNMGTTLIFLINKIQEFGNVQAKISNAQSATHDYIIKNFSDKSPNQLMHEAAGRHREELDAIALQQQYVVKLNGAYKELDQWKSASWKERYNMRSEHDINADIRNLSSEIKSVKIGRAEADAAVVTLNQLYAAKVPNADTNKILGPDGLNTNTSKSKSHDYTNLELSIQKRINDAVYQLSKERLEGQMTIEKGIADNEKNTLNQRLAALKTFYDLKGQLVKIDEGHEEGDIDVKLNKIAEIEKKSIKSRSQEEKNLLLTKQALLAERLVIEEKANTQSLENYGEYYKAIESIQKQGEAELLKISEQNIQSEEGRGLLASLEVKLAQYKELADKFKSGKISNDEFNAGKNLIDDNSQKQAIEEDQKALLEKKSLHEQNGKDTIDIDKQIYDNKIKLLDLEIKKEEEVASKKLQLQQNIKDGLKQLGEEMINVAKVAVESQYENQKNAVQKQIDLLNKGKEAEIKAVESSTENEQQKANRIAIIQANAATETERLDRKKRDLSIKEAEFEKEAAILSVVIKTAEAVAQSELEASILASNPLTVALAPMALAQIPIEIAVGAAQAAAILAKPIPKYATGTESAPGGLALTDERGPELYIEPSGKTYLGNGKPTLRNVVKGTQIIPHDQLNQMILQAAVSDTLLLSGIKDNSMDKKLDEIKNVMMWQTGQLEKAYGKNKAPKIIFKNQEGWNSYIRKSVYE